MKKIIFETDLLPDGHLYCPSEFLGKKNLHFDVIVSFEEQDVTDESQQDSFIKSAGSWEDLDADFCTEEKK